MIRFGRRTVSGALALALCVGGCGDADGTRRRTSASGFAIDFGPRGGGAIAGGEVTILEFPERRTETGADGSFRFDDLPSGAEVSFVLRHPARPELQTATLRLGAVDLEQLTFQSPTRAMFRLLAEMVRVEPMPDRCQIASTVTRREDSTYQGVPDTHGEPGATVTIDPPLPPAQGPIYFNLLRADLIFPDRTLTQTTDDGGVLFVNVPPGRYELSAHEPGTQFRSVTIKCRAGVVVNAAPPWGLQVVAGGAGSVPAPMPVRKSRSQ